MRYQIAEKFKSIQGEGVYTGTPMAFIRFVGCSVGKTVCSACDTDFEQSVPWRGGGAFTVDELHTWMSPYLHICLTGGEPFDQDLVPFLAFTQPAVIHIETSGTKELPLWVDDLRSQGRCWICVSPKPGFLERTIQRADEVKVIMPGLGALKHGNVLSPSDKLLQIEPARELDDKWQVPETTITLPRWWPTLEDALRWARAGKTVFLQPRNDRNEINWQNLRLCQDIIAEHPELRLSVQMHKILKVQ